ncbi:MAG: phosphatase PAP2 family protein [Betaproteobacteria bacterium]
MGLKARHRRLWPAWLLLLACVLLFLVWPELDLIVTRYFFDPLNQEFPANALPWVKWVYDDTPVINQWLGLLMLSALLLQWIRPGWPGLRARRSMCAWLLVVCIGLGFTVDWVLKDHFGRPHPYQTHVFTGDQDFVPAFHYRPLCEVNCSFVSGHAAGGFVWMAWGMWGWRRRRQAWLLAGVAAGSFIGAARVMQGGHFLSDVVFSGWVIWLSMQAIRTVWLRLRRRRLQKFTKSGPSTL